MANKIQLFGELESVAVDKKLVDASQVKDSSWKDKSTDENATEKTQSDINKALREAAEAAATSASDLKINYDSKGKLIELYTGEGDNKKTLSSISSADFTKDGMIEKVIGPVTPTWDNVENKAMFGGAKHPEEVYWAVDEKTGDEGFWAQELAKGWLSIGKVTLGHTYLGFIWNTNTDKGTIGDNAYNSDTFKASALDVSTLVDVYTNGDGLDLTEGTFSVKLGDNEKYLTVEVGALVTKGIDNAISDAANKAKGFNFTKKVTEGTSVNLYAGDNVDAVENNLSYTLNHGSIYVLDKDGYPIEVSVRVPKGPYTPAAFLEWQGITPTTDEPIYVHYRVVLK